MRSRTIKRRNSRNRSFRKTKTFKRRVSRRTISKKSRKLRGGRIRSRSISKKSRKLSGGATLQLLSIWGTNSQFVNTTPLENKWTVKIEEKTYPIKINETDDSKTNTYEIVDQAETLPANLKKKFNTPTELRDAVVGKTTRHSMDTEFSSKSRTGRKQSRVLGLNSSIAKVAMGFSK
jgi:hypothetical protein